MLCLLGDASRPISMTNNPMISFGKKKSNESSSISSTHIQECVYSWKYIIDTFANSHPLALFLNKVPPIIFSFYPCFSYLVSVNIIRS